jgi:hypothetical protein
MRPGVFGATEIIRPNNRFPEKGNERGDATFQQVSALCAPLVAGGVRPAAARGHCHMGRGQGRIGAGD